MSSSDLLFATRLYRASIAGRGAAALNRDLAATCLSFSRDDKAGRTWAKAHGYAGYTSYASLDDLAWRAPAFEDLQRRLTPHVAQFARELDFDLAGRRLELDSLWINVLDKGGAHSGHIHPNCVVSGTYYVEVPPGAGAIRFEDPRLAQMMAAPPRKSGARAANRAFIEVAPKTGMLLLWESWLRHEVLANQAQTRRISVSFNYRSAAC